MEIKEILEVIALPARSSKKGFKVTDKLEAIDNLLQTENSPYRLIHKGPHAWIFGQKVLEEDTEILLVSSHADIVDEITAPFSEYVEAEKYCRGTYDNLGTNGACVNLMLNESLPDTVYFAFTSDEETGRCKGAGYALSYVVEKTGVEPTVFALDVTEEGYDNNRLFTVEGLHGKTETFRREMLGLFMSTEGGEQSFEVVRLKEKDDDSVIPKSYRAEDTVEYDESVFYAKKGCNSCSICLPGDGSMHSNAGFYVKEAVMKGYSLGLAASILTFLNVDRDRVNEIKAQKDALVAEARETEFHKFRYSYNYTPAYQKSAADTSYPYLGDAKPRNLGEYWTKRMREVEPEDDSYQQITLADLDNEFDCDICDENDIEDRIQYFIDHNLDDLFEMSSNYVAEDYDVFFSDVLYTYGIEDDDYEVMDTLEEYLLEIFADVHQEYEEDYE